jgi:hypothetical protein
MPKTLPPLRVDGADLDNLRASGLTDATIRANELWTETDPARVARILRWSPTSWSNGSALVFPYRDLDGQVNCFARVRPHHPRKDSKGNSVKYESPVGSGLRPYFPTASLPRLKDGSSDIYLTEGEKKALLLSQHGFAAVGLGGVWGWKNKGTDELIDSLAAIPWKGRRVFIVFDWDPKPKTRRDVALAARRLAAALRRVGAGETFIVELPPGPEGTKQGVDDFFVAQGANAKAAFDKLVKDAPSAFAPLFANFTVHEFKDDKGKTKRVLIGKTPQAIRKTLTVLVGDWPKRVGGLLFSADGYEPRWLPKTEDLFAWIGGQLPEPVQWADGTDKASRNVFAAYLRQNADHYEAVERLPHYPQIPDHFYLHPAPTGGDGATLRAFVDRFHPATSPEPDPGGGPDPVLGRQARTAPRLPVRGRG